MILKIAVTTILGACFAFAAPPAKSGDASWVEALDGVVIRNAEGKVTGVDLRGTWVSDTDVRKLNDLPDLTYLNLALTYVSDQGMQEIKNLPNITELNLHFAEYITDEGIAVLKGWKKLKKLNIHGTKASDTSLDHISGLTALEYLNAGSIMVTDVGLERLTMLTNLKDLAIGGNEIGDAGLQALRQMPWLTHLDLRGRQGTDSNVWSVAMSETGLEAVLTLKNLRELHFGCNSIGVGYEGQKFAEVSPMSIRPLWLERMKTLPKLEKLTLQGCTRLNDESIKALLGMPALKEVDLKGTAVTEKGAAELRAAKPNLVVRFGPWAAKAASFRNN